MTRLELGGVRVKKEWQSVEEVVGAALNRTESLLAERQVTARVPGELLAPFDGVLVQQLLVNLLENAAKYTPAGTPIEVEVRAEPQEVVISVLDRGAGISSDEQSRIFEKFHRGESDRTKSGIGLGLTICRAIAVAHAGRIWVENRAGGGAVFSLALPLEGPAPEGGLPEILEQSS
jgi:two-component system sensor histidine kinase KdpD